MRTDRSEAETEPMGSVYALAPLHQKTLKYHLRVFDVREQVMGIEPTYSAWKADVLPLNHTCGQGVFYLALAVKSTEFCISALAGFQIIHKLTVIFVGFFVCFYSIQ